MLADAAGTSMERRKLGDAKKLVERARGKLGSRGDAVDQAEIHGSLTECGEPPRHRAEAGAPRLALTFAAAIASVVR